MKIKYLTEDNVNSIRKNLSGIYRKVVAGECTISDFFDDNSFVNDSSLDVNDFQLDMSQPKGRESLTDLENVKRIYNNMSFLSDSQASDERIWVAYTFSVFIDYMRYRWPTKKEDDLKNRYMFGYSSQRSLFRNGISRLWWIGRFSYDKNRSDPYELTKFLCKDQDYIETFCGRNIFNNPMIGNAVISAVYDAEQGGIVINRDKVRDIGKYLNLLAGTYLLDALDKEDIYRKVCIRLGMK